MKFDKDLRYVYLGKQNVLVAGENDHMVTKLKRSAALFYSFIYLLCQATWAIKETAKWPCGLRIKLSPAQGSVIPISLYCTNANQKYCQLVLHIVTCKTLARKLYQILNSTREPNPDTQM